MVNIELHVRSGPLFIQVEWKFDVIDLSFIFGGPMFHHLLFLALRICRQSSILHLSHELAILYLVTGLTFSFVFFWSRLFHHFF